MAELTRRRPRDEDGGRGEQEDPIDPTRLTLLRSRRDREKLRLISLAKSFTGHIRNLHRRFVIGRVPAEPGGRWVPPRAASSQGLPAGRGPAYRSGRLSAAVNLARLSEP